MTLYYVPARKGRNIMKISNNSALTAAYYLERATECERLAQEAVTEENREILLKLAARWCGFAAEKTEGPPKRGC
jgi:hypothetical protein